MLPDVLLNWKIKHWYKCECLILHVLPYYMIMNISIPFWAPAQRIAQCAESFWSLSDDFVAWEHTFCCISYIGKYNFTCFIANHILYYSYIYILIYRCIDIYLRTFIFVLLAFYRIYWIIVQSLNLEFFYNQRNL